MAFSDKSFIEVQFPVSKVSKRKLQGKKGKFRTDANRTW